MDSDVSHDPKKINSFVKELKKYPVVIGSKYISGGRNDLKDYRFFLSYLGNKFIKFLFNTQQSEFTTSFRGLILIKLKLISIK